MAHTALWVRQAELCRGALRDHNFFFSHSHAACALFSTAADEAWTVSQGSKARQLRISSAGAALAGSTAARPRSLCLDLA
jgi:hypothetical protein